MCTQHAHLHLSYHILSKMWSVYFEDFGSKRWHPSLRSVPLRPSMWWSKAAQAIYVYCIVTQTKLANYTIPIIFPFLPALSSRKVFLRWAILSGTTVCKRSGAKSLPLVNKSLNGTHWNWLSEFWLPTLANKENVPEPDEFIRVVIANINGGGICKELMIKEPYNCSSSIWNNLASCFSSFPILCCIDCFERPLPLRSPARTSSPQQRRAVGRAMVATLLSRSLSLF